ncbi:MAG: esterase [Acidobacteriota bacterium]|nr:esterase [Acidobacteriota bacterium]
MKLKILAIAAVCAGLTVYAQAPGGRGGGRGMFGGPAVKSPEVAADGSVTFRLRAPQAQEVFVTLSGRMAMTKDDQGVWSVTTKPMEPDYYPYNFIVDGVSISDPSNPIVKSIVTGGFQSFVHVPGPSSLSWELNDVPHGKVDHHFYKSAIIGDNRDFYVYTPPNYDPNGKTLYPVLYLIHGFTDDASGWPTAGRENVILDNLIAQGKAKPMIVVNPLGYGTPNPDSNLMAVMANPEKQFQDVSRALMEEVLPMVEREYKVAKDRNSRAISGLSMGGAETFYIGLNHIDQFAYVAGMSSAFVMYPRPGGTPAAGGGAGGRGAGGRGQMQHMDASVFSSVFPKLDAKAASRLKLLYVACGTDDGLIGVNRDFKDFLKSKDIAYTNIETPGAHTWMVWRRNLTEIAPMLFQDRK